MEQYISKSAIMAEIERLKERFIAFHHRDGNDWPLDNYGKMRAYNELLSFINTLEVKEVNLEKFTEKIKTFQGRYKYPEIISIKGAMAFMARMFYQYPNVAREWYESLLKATMD